MPACGRLAAVPRSRCTGGRDLKRDRGLQDEMVRVLKLPDVRERFATLGVDPVGSTPEEFARVIAADIAKWTAVAKAANIKAD